MNHCSIYLKETGQIIQYSNFTCQNDPEHINKNYQTRLDLYGSTTHGLIRRETDPASEYVALMGDEFVVVPRPAIPYSMDKAVVISDSADFVTITGLHDPCEIVIDDPDPLVETTTVTVTGGGFQFSAANAGLYTIQIDKFPFLPLTLQITAVNPQADETASFDTDFSYEFGL